MESHTRILLVEDSVADANNVADLLEGGSLSWAQSVSEACAHLSMEHFDIVLLDLGLPDSSGLETVERVVEARPECAVVVLSGQADVEMAARAVELGAQDYLVKEKIDRSTLTRSLRHARSRHELTRRLEESEARYALALQGAHDGLWDWDLMRDQLYVSERWLQMLGLEEEVRTPEDWMRHVHPVDLPEVEAAIDAHRAGTSPHLEVEHRMRTRDGALIWVLTRGLIRRDPDGQAVRMAGSMTDITRYKQVEARLRYDATHDRLTGLPNRMLLLDRLEHCIRRRRNSSGFAVLFIDLDRFKLVNDSMGHAVGDRFLQAFVQRVRPLIRPSDTFARVGGDEFCVLIEDTSRVEDPEVVADRIQGALSDPLQVDGQALFASASIGVADSAHQYERSEDMLRDADIAMYRAKSRRSGSRGRSRGQEHEALVERFALETELRFALSNGELDLAFQPIVCVRTGRLDGYEALMRWHSPTRGSVGPEVFIPVAKETGLLPGLGRWALFEACARISRFSKDSNTRPSVSVNLSPVELVEPDLADWVRSALERADLPPDQLVLEVTEDVLFEHGAVAAGTFRALRELGVCIDLDDFGTGFSSLGHLRHLPVDRLKIDRSFVSNMHARKEDREIIRAIVALGRTLGKRVVAEGIEARAQLASVAAFGADFGQGFLFAPPGPLRLYEGPELPPFSRLSAL